MPILQIHDLQPQSVAVVDPRVVLPILGKRATQASWQIAGVTRFDELLFATGEGATELEALAQTLKCVPGTVLGDILGQIRQIIWGEFIARENGQDAPWVILRAIDGSWCEVDTDDADVLDRVRQIFADVRMGS